MWKVAVGLLACAGVSGCGTLPKGVAGPRVPTARIVEAVRCELATAFALGNPDPARMKDWRVLTTVTIDSDSGYEIHPGIAGVAGKAGRASWKAPNAGTTFKQNTKRNIKTEYKVRDIRAAIDSAPCPAPGSPDAYRGLEVGAWLRDVSAGQPAAESDATPATASYTRTYTAAVNTGGGLTFAFADFSLSFEGNKANLENTYKIDVRLGPQTGPNAPFFTEGLAREFGLNQFGEFDDFSDLRRERDREEQEDTIIKVPPGQAVIIE